MLSDSGDDANTLQIKEDFQRPFEVFENVASFLNEGAEVEDDVLIIVHVANKLLYEGAQLLSQTYAAKLICHKLFVDP